MNFSSSAVPRLHSPHRRRLLRHALAATAALLGLRLLPGCSATIVDSRSNIGNLGPLGVADANGVRLPPGFTSRIVARSGVVPVAGGSAWHPAPDGGACFPAAGGGWIYVSNSEMSAGAGGVGALQFDAAGIVVACYPILTGTDRNCAGGKMPWGIWLSCEESGDAGRVFACDPLGVAAATELPALGRRNHEAAAWDASQGRLYLTEDRPDSGLYRFTPAAFLAPGVPDLSSGTLEVAHVAPYSIGPVTWLTVPDPAGTTTPTRYQVSTMTKFDRGEGIVARDGLVYFATTGDSRVWAYDPSTARLSVLYDDNTSPTPILTNPDNMEVSSAGDLLMAEDGGDRQIVAITPINRIVPIVQLVGHDGSEITGPAFDPSGSRLYFSSQRGTSGTAGGGTTFEVSGPFLI